MFSTTTNSIEGHPVREYLGIVTGEVIVGANLFRDLFASITDIVGGRSGKYEDVLARARKEALGEMEAEAEESIERQVGPITVTGDGPLVVREKTHPASPMTLDQALYEMELVGHDFYLYVDKESERPAVVYRRRGYDYGVISLEVDVQGG